MTQCQNVVPAPSEIGFLVPIVFLVTAPDFAGMEAAGYSQHLYSHSDSPFSLV